jgi:hypothetical protein
VSRSLKPFVAYGFESTHRALDAEAVLERQGVDVVPIPAPTSLGALCGIALRVPCAQSTHAEECLREAEIHPSASLPMDDC